MHHSVPQLTFAVSLSSCPHQIHKTALSLFILYIFYCQFEADAQMLRCPKWARCSDAILLDYLMRVNPQIHPCLQSPGLVCDAPCVAAELPVAPESVTDCLNSHVIFLVQGGSLHQISDIQNSEHTFHSARGTNSTDHDSCRWRWPQWRATQWTTLLWKGLIFPLTKQELCVGNVSVQSQPGHWSSQFYCWRSTVLAKSTRWHESEDADSGEHFSLSMCALHSGAESGLGRCQLPRPREFSSLSGTSCIFPLLLYIQRRK